MQLLQRNLFHKLMQKKFALGLLPTNCIGCWKSQVFIEGQGILFSAGKKKKVKYDVFLFLQKA